MKNLRLFAVFNNFLLPNKALKFLGRLPIWHVHNEKSACLSQLKQWILALIAIGADVGKQAIRKCSLLLNHMAEAALLRNKKYYPSSSTQNGWLDGPYKATNPLPVLSTG